VSTSDKMPRRALVLAGAAAKGAFEVGAIAALVEHGITFGTIIGTSAGALNASYFAAGVRAGREREAVREMVDFWIERARWRTFLDVSTRDIFAGRGLSGSRRIEWVLRERMAPLAALPATSEVQLRMVASRLAAGSGVDGATGYEHVFSFAGPDFATRLDEIAHAAVASSAFPVLFAPVNVPTVGACVDGGLVANTPFAEAIAAGNVEEVYILTPWSPADGDANRLGGLSLISRWIEIAVSERFSREIAHAERAHAQLRVLAEARDRGTLTEEQHWELQRRLGLRHAARIVVIRPALALPGDLLSGFGDQGLRAEYVARGRAAAEHALTIEVT
jgi:NTE family protein